MARKLMDTELTVAGVQFDLLVEDRDGYVLAGVDIQYTDYENSNYVYFRMTNDPEHEYLRRDLDQLICALQTMRNLLC